MHLLYPSLCIVGFIVLTKEQRGPSSFMVAFALLVRISSGLSISYHSGASRLLQEGARCRGPDRSTGAGRRSRRGLGTRDLECTCRRSLAAVAIGCSAFADRATRSVATRARARQLDE